MSEAVFGDTAIRHSGTRYAHIGACTDDCYFEVCLQRDRLRRAIEDLRRIHWAQREKHQSAAREIAENSDPEGDERYDLYWHRSMAEVHQDIASDLAALISPSAIAVAELSVAELSDLLVEADANAVAAMGWYWEHEKAIRAAGVPSPPDFMVPF